MKPRDDGELRHNSTMFAFAFNLKANVLIFQLSFACRAKANDVTPIEVFKLCRSHSRTGRDFNMGMEF
ncbi:hypothetical protein D3C87_1988040 [compost metagenome]